MKHKKSQWFLALLDAEQHVFEGYSEKTLLASIDKKLYDGHVSKEAHQAVYDYFWYRNYLKETYSDPD